MTSEPLHLQERSKLKSFLKIHMHSRSKHSKVNFDVPCLSKVETQCCSQNNSCELEIDFIQTSEAERPRFTLLRWYQSNNQQFGSCKNNFSFNNCFGWTHTIISHKSKLTKIETVLSRQNKHYVILLTRTWDNQAQTIHLLDSNELTCKYKNHFQCHPGVVKPIFIGWQPNDIFSFAMADCQYKGHLVYKGDVDSKTINPILWCSHGSHIHTKIWSLLYVGLI
jgi:hypothetical protein